MPVCLTPRDKRRLQTFWVSDRTLAEIAEEMGWTVSRVRYAARLMGLGRRRTRAYLPTPQEIRAVSAIIRAGWSSAEREARIAAAWGGRMNATGKHNGAASGTTDADVPPR